MPKTITVNGVDGFGTWGTDNLISLGNIPEQFPVTSVSSTRTWIHGLENYSLSARYKITYDVEVFGTVTHGLNFYGTDSFTYVNVTPNTITATIDTSTGASITASSDFSVTAEFNIPAEEKSGASAKQLEFRVSNGKGYVVKNVKIVALQSNWSLHPNAYVIDDNTLQLNATAQFQNSVLTINNIIPGETYYIGDIPTNAFMHIYALDQKGNSLQTFTYKKNTTITMPLNTSYITCNLGNDQVGNYTFSNLSINRGKYGAVWEKKRGSFMITPTPSKNLIPLGAYPRWGTTITDLGNGEYQVTTAGANGDEGITFRLPQYFGQSVIFSADVKATGMSLRMGYGEGGVGYVGALSNITATSDYQRFTFTSTTKTSYANPTNPMEYTISTAATQAGTFYVRFAQVEKGNVDTGYEPYKLISTKRISVTNPPNKGLVFDGFSTYLQGPSLTTLAPLSANSHTFYAKVKPVYTGGDEYIVAFNGYHQALYFGADYRFRFTAFLDTDATGTSFGTSMAMASTHTFTVGQVYEVYGVVDFQAMQVRLYVNGVLEGTYTIPAGATMKYYDSYGSVIRIGCGNAPGQSYASPFKGEMYQVGIYKSAVDLNNLPSNPAVWYDFTNPQNFTGNSFNQATLYGAAKIQNKPPTRMLPPK